jgi:transcriptional regulator with XRE-family HTH domain
MTITPAQSRSARALLYLSQSEVSDKAKVDQSQLSKFENPNSEVLLSYASLQKIEHFYISKGLEFIEGDGVRRRVVGMMELQGANGFKDFIDNVYETVKGGGDICVSNVDEKLFERWQGEYAHDYLSKMEKVKDLRFRVLVQEGDTYFTAKYAQYRFLPSEYFTGVPTYVYGSKKAEILFEDNTVRVFVIDNARMAEAQRKSFELAWELARDTV